MSHEKLQESLYTVSDIVYLQSLNTIFPKLCTHFTNFPHNNFEKDMGPEVMSFKAGNGTKTITMSISVIAVFSLAFWLIYKSTQDFLNSTVTSTIDATDIPLSEVYFPSVTICNINQVGYLFMHLFSLHCTICTVL